MVDFSMGRGLQLPSFRTAKNLVHGKNALMSLRSINSSRVAVVYSSSSLRDEAKRKKLINNIRSNEIAMIEKDWPETFCLDDLKKAVGQIEAIRADTIIAVGGGSVIDAAKLCWLLYEKPSFNSKSGYNLRNPMLRGKANFIAVPTTVGSGSEVSSSAILFDPETDSKKPVVTHEFLPDLAVLDPLFVTDLPRDILVSSACDAVTHAIEGYVSRISNSLMQGFANEAVRTILANVDLFSEETSETRGEELLIASAMAGWVQNHCMTGACHAIAHQLASFGLSHAKANAILLPTVIQLNSRDEEVKSAYETLAASAGIAGGAEALMDRIVALRQIGGFSTSLRTYSTKIDANRIADAVYADPSCNTNPVAVDIGYIEEVLATCD